ncbi:MAG: acyltransferase family protein [Aquabacterium sp.]
MRLPSLDLLRGSAVALMIGVNNPGSWAHLYPPLAHAPWHGLTPTDLVFPFFLFAVGNALALTLPALRACGGAALARKWLWRVGLIFALGLLLNAAPGWVWAASGDLALRDWGGLRIMGVLQRIALAWGAAALILLPCLAATDAPVRRRRVLIAAAVLLLLYHGVCVAFAQGSDPYSLEGFFGTALDRMLLGPRHLYGGEGVPFDPEGLASTVPAVAQVLIGAWAGLWMRDAPLTSSRALATVPGLVIAGLALLALGGIWADLMPVNKKLWTSSFVLVTSGLALLMLALLSALHDKPPDAGRTAPWPVLGWLTPVVKAFGRNALFVFVLSGLVPRLLSLVHWPDGLVADGLPRWITPLQWLYRTLFADLADDRRVGSLAYALAHLAVYAALAVWLDRRRIYIRV